MRTAWECLTRATTAFTLVDISSTISGTGKFRGAAAASNGKVIFAPCNADGVGVFDPNAPPDEAFTPVDISHHHLN